MFSIPDHNNYYFVYLLYARHSAVSGTTVTYELMSSIVQGVKLKFRLGLVP